jgi:hypothetical protein
MRCVPPRYGSLTMSADEHREPELALRDQRAVARRIDAVRAVQRLGDHRREGRAHEREVHLVADLLQAVLDDGQRDRIELAHGVLV